MNIFITNRTTRKAKYQGLQEYFPHLATLSHLYFFFLSFSFLPTYLSDFRVKEKSKSKGKKKIKIHLPFLLLYDITCKLKPMLH